MRQCSTLRPCIAPASMALASLNQTSVQQQQQTLTTQHIALHKCREALHHGTVHAARPRPGRRGALHP